jgi:pimeloyl-ACP methyl ester carboxylesterase
MVEKKSARKSGNWSRFMRMSAVSLALVPLQWLIQRVIDAFRVNSLLKTTLEYCYLRSAFLQSILSFRVWDLHFSVASEDEIHIQQLAGSCGLNAVTKSAITEDGYVLTLLRLEKLAAEDNTDADGQSVVSDVDAKSPSTSKSPTPSSTTSSSSDETSSPASSPCSPPPPSPGHKKRIPILLIHGLLQDCESFLCCGQRNSLAAVLAHEGYDVWLGNNRGNRYSNKHVDVTADVVDYWNFSIDHLANYDLLAMVKCMLQTVNNEQRERHLDPIDHVIVIGFSQGSAQTLLGLSTSQYLQDHINLFVALSPPIKLKGFNSTWLASVLTAFPSLVSLIFGRRAMFPNVLSVKNTLSNSMFAKLVCGAVYFLFGWRCANIDPSRRPALFQHVFSPSSVLCVLHWFQIMENNELVNYRYSPSDHKVYFSHNSDGDTAASGDGSSDGDSSRFYDFRTWTGIAWTLSTWWISVIRILFAYVFAHVIPTFYRNHFQQEQSSQQDAQKTNNKDTNKGMDGELKSPTPQRPGKEQSTGRSETASATLTPSYDINNVNCPIAIFAGDADGLIDTHDIDAHTPNCIFAHIEPGYEHLDVLWADTAPSHIFPKIVKVLRTHASHNEKMWQMKQEASQLVAGKA